MSRVEFFKPSGSHSAQRLLFAYPYGTVGGNVLPPSSFIGSCWPVKESGLFLAPLFYEFRCMKVGPLGLGAGNRPIYLLAIFDQFSPFGLHVWVGGERVQLGSIGFCLGSADFKKAAALSTFPDIVFSVRSIVRQVRLALREM
jgi:hypothetical protein